MKKILSIICLCISVSVYAQTTIAGGTLSGTLSASGSPYLLTADITVPEDSVLIIEAGVILDFNRNIKILAFGIVSSLGTSESPVKFTCTEDTLNGWKGLYLLADISQGMSILRHTIFEHSGYYQSGDFNWEIRGYTPRGGGVLAYYTALEIENCTFQELRHGMDIHGSYVRIKDCEFKNFYEGWKVGLLDSNDIVVSRCSFINSGRIAIANVLNTDEPNIINCHFENNLGGGLVLSDKAWADSCTFLKNENIVVQLVDFKGTLSNCTIDSSYGDNPYGTSIKTIRGASEGVIRNCTFKNTYLNGNIATIDIFIRNEPPLIENCLFYNGMGISFSGSDTLQVINCIFYKNRQCVIGRRTKIINCLFLDNLRNEVYKTDPSWYEANRRSSCLVNSNSDFSVYNSVFWGNRNYFNQNVNATVINYGETRFYNCIIEGGQSSLTKVDSPSYVFSGVYEDCIETAPSFYGNPETKFEFSQSCNQLPSGFNKGYMVPIYGKYRGVRVSNLFDYVDDANGNPRIWNDTIDIGPYEAQGLLSRIDIAEHPLSTLACLGDTALFTPLVYGLGLDMDWQKSIDGSSFTSVGNSSKSLVLAEVSAHDSGVFYRQRITNQCNDEAITDVAELTVRTADSISIGSDLVIPKDSTITLSPGSEFSSYTWSTGDVDSVITVSGVTLGVGEHTVQVEVTDEYGCTSEAQIVITVVQGAGIREMKHKLAVYPNPGASKLYFKQVYKGTISIVNTLGEKVLRQDLSGNEMDVTNLGSGMYYLTIQTKDTVYQATWIKE